MYDSRPNELPLVSIILPTYDRPRLLLDAVESVAEQTYEDIELIVVDDHSPEPAEEILDESAPDGLRWRCLRHESNEGANVARNTGIRASNGSYIAFLDDDDRWDPKKIERQIAAIEDSHSDVGVVIVGQKYVDDDGNQTATRRPSLTGDVTEEILRGRPAGSFSTVLVRASVIPEAGVPDERFPTWQDREWLLRLSKHCDFRSISEPLVIRTIGSHGQISDNFEGKSQISYPLFLEKHRSLAAEYGCEGTLKATLAASVSRTGLSTGHYREAAKFALVAIRADPTLRSGYVFLLLSLGGRFTYRPAVRIKRALAATSV